MPGGADGPAFRPMGHSTARGEAAPSGQGGPGGELRLALSLPGGIAPGTFEAGATCGLLAWIQEVNSLQADAVLVDVIAGASAGSLTGLLAARVLLGGDDPVGVYRQAWVVAPSLRALRSTGSSAPLSLRPARDAARRILFAPVPPRVRWRQRSSVALELALGSLRGFSRRIPSHTGAPDPEQQLIAASYLDWASFELHELAGDSGTAEQQWTRAMEAAIASASHPLAFRARRLDRESSRSAYLESGVVNLPAGEEALTLWYTDGGLLDNEPLGRCVLRVSERDGRQLPSRLVMLVRSRVRWPPRANNPAWSGHGRPNWTQTLVRVLDLVVSNAAGRDLLQVEQTNQRLRATKDVAATLVELLDDDEATRLRLQGLLARIEHERAAFGRVAPRRVTPIDPTVGGQEDLIANLLLSAAGLIGKQPVDVAVVSADSALVAPEALRSVIGFLDRRQREDHFAAGYWSMLGWIQHASALENRLPPDLIAASVLAAQRKVPDPRLRGGGKRSRGLSPGLRLELARLGIRTGLIARADLDDLFDASRQPSPRPRRPRRPRGRVGTRRFIG